MKKYINVSVMVERDGDRDITSNDISFLIGMANEVLAENTFCGYKVKVSQYASEVQPWMVYDTKPLDCVGTDGCKSDSNQNGHCIMSPK